MNKIYTFAIIKRSNERISDARARDFMVVGEMEVYDGMPESEFEKTRIEIGIPDDAIVISVRAV